jgi:hypothetical protein
MILLSSLAKPNANPIADTSSFAGVQDQETSKISAEPIGIIATLELRIRLVTVTATGRIFPRFTFDRLSEYLVRIDEAKVMT